MKILYDGIIDRHGVKFLVFKNENGESAEIHVEPQFAQMLAMRLSRICKPNTDVVERGNEE